MILKGDSLFVSRKSGLKKNGDAWFSIKFLDDEADEFFTCFVDEKLFNTFEGITKKTAVGLTLDLVPGSKYFSLVGFELA